MNLRTIAIALTSSLAFISSPDNAACAQATYDLAALPAGATLHRVVAEPAE